MLADDGGCLTSRLLDVGSIGRAFELGSRACGLPLLLVQARIMGLFGRKPVHVELEVSSDTFDVVYLCVCGLVVAKALAAVFRRGRLAATLRARVASLVEAGAYAFAYAAIALCFGGCVDGLFGAYDGAARLPSVLLEVCLQAAANAVFAQLARDVVGSLDLPGAGEHLAASGGGVIFAFLLFSRQAHWKRKVALAGTLLDRHMPRGVPPRAAAGLGL